MCCDVLQSEKGSETARFVEGFLQRNMKVAVVSCFGDKKNIYQTGR
jgi:hypothetical protein